MLYCGGGRIAALAIPNSTRFLVLHLYRNAAHTAGPASGERLGALRGSRGLSDWALAHAIDLAAILLHAVFTVVFLWPVAVQGMVPAGYDLVTYFYPYKAYLGEMVRQGVPPLWNPSIFMGAPLLANIQAAVFYPPDILFYLLPTTDALRISVVLHVFFAATFSYLFARWSLSLSPVAAWVCGAVFAYGGFVGAQVGHLNQLHAAVWLPLLLLCLERALSARSVAAVALGGVVLACQILAGHTQEVYYSCVALGLFALCQAAFGREGGLKDRLLPLGAMLGVVGIGAAVAGVQLLPSLELAGQSYRSGGIPFGEAVGYSVHLRDLLDSLLPLYTSLPYVEVAGYTGVLSLALLPAALATRRRDQLHWFFLCLAVLALLLSFGDGTPLYGVLFRLVPGFDLFRAPGRWLFLYGFSVAALAGIGLDSLIRHRRAEEWTEWMGRYGLAMGVGLAAFAALRLWMGTQGEEFGLPHGRVVMTWSLLLGAGVALSLAAFSRQAHRTALLLLVILLMADLYQAREPMEYNRPLDANVYSGSRPILSLLAGQPPARVLTLAVEQYQMVDEDDLKARLARQSPSVDVTSYLGYTRLREIVAPNTGMSSGLSSVDGYDGGLLPTRRYAELKQTLMGSREYKPDLSMRGEPGQIPDSRTLGAFGVGYLLLGPERGDPGAGWEEIGAGTGGPVRVLRNRNLLPRAFVVHRAQLFGDDSQLLAALRQADLSQTVLLRDDLQFPDVEAPGVDRVTVVADVPNAVDLEATLEKPGFLVLSDSYYPGWKVYVDGSESHLLRADHAIRAVQLPAGSHQVRFVYDPLSFKAGLGLSAMGLLAVLVILTAGRRWRSAEASAGV
ncbi:MAG TPA: YfhO family protein [Chloroflexota bacterium]|nr:YfhO family protein [Chloroflexota bacterium]